VTLATALLELQSNVSQCDSLITNAHRVDAAGVSILPLVDRQQITVAAFLNLFVAWESFVEDTMTKLMSGSPTISGKYPTRYVSPPSQDSAKTMVIGINRYFDYANHNNLRRVVSMYFQAGYPFEPHLSSISSDLADLRTLRNASAHITSTTQKALEALAQRVLATPSSGINLYTLLTSHDSRSSLGTTIFESSKTKLLVAAGLIAYG